MGLVIKTNGGLVKTASGGVSFSAKTRFEGFFFIVESRTIKKFNSITGSEATSFASNLGTISSNIYAAVKTLDNKIVIAGDFSSIGGTTVNKIAKIDSDGNLDTNFNSGGSGFNGTVTCMTQMSDGRIVLGGVFTSYNGSTCKNICCINADGSLDTDFVGSSSFGSSYTYGIEQLAVDGQNRVVVATAIGVNTYTFTDSNSNTHTVNDKFYRLSSDGVFDEDFNDNRDLYPQNPRNQSYQAIDMAVDKAGNIYVAFNDLYFDGIIREGAGKINSDGTHNTMSDWGYNYYAIKSSVVVQSDGNPIFGQVYYPIAYRGTNPWTVKRQAGLIKIDSTTGLSIDTWNQDGTGLRNVPPANVLALEPSISGIPLPNPPYPNEWNIFSYYDWYGRCDKIFLLPDDSLVVVGYFSYYNHKPVSNIVHLNRNGTVNEASPDFSSMVSNPQFVNAILTM